MLCVIVNALGVVLHPMIGVGFIIRSLLTVEVPSQQGLSQVSKVDGLRVITHMFFRHHSQETK